MTAPLDLFDSHAHLDFPDLDRNLEAVLARARAAGVRRIVTIGAGGGLESSRRAIEIARDHEGVHAAIGIHPHDASLATDAAFATLEESVRAHPDVVAIGETGLDYHYDNSPRDVQRESFRRSIRLARALGLPLIVHTREAEHDTIAILDEEPGARDTGGIIHCFSGTAWLAERALELGFHLSFSGIVTFPKATEVQAVAASAPAERLLVETDSPYLAPVPHRGKTNEPAFVEHTLRFVARLRGDDPAELARRTTENALAVYRIPRVTAPRAP